MKLLPHVDLELYFRRHSRSDRIDGILVELGVSADEVGRIA
jgi:hypothetical protein